MLREECLTAIPKSLPPGAMERDLRGALHIAFPRRLAQRDRMMLTLQGYFDDSGTHRSSQAITLAGYISTAEQWACFDEEWSAALSEWNLGFFHMTEFANRANAYKDWSNQERKFRFARLAAIIKKHTVASVAVGFLRSSYNQSFDKRTKQFVGPYGVAAMMCLTDVAERLGPAYPSARIAYVFEAGTEGKGQILSLFDMNFCNDDNREHFKLLSIKFEDKRDFTPLQAADVLAYEHYRQLPKDAGLDNHSTREEIKLLVPDDERVIKGWGWFNDDEVLKFAHVSWGARVHYGDISLRQVADKIVKESKRERYKGHQ